MVRSTFSSTGMGSENMSCHMGAPRRSRWFPAQVSRPGDRRTATPRPHADVLRCAPYGRSEVGRRLGRFTRPDSSGRVGSPRRATMGEPSVARRTSSITIVVPSGDPHVLVPGHAYDDRRPPAAAHGRGWDRPRVRRPRRRPPRTGLHPRVPVSASPWERAVKPDPRLPVRAGRLLRVRAVWMVPLVLGSVVIAVMTAVYIS